MRKIRYLLTVLFIVLAAAAMWRFEQSSQAVTIVTQPKEQLPGSTREDGYDRYMANYEQKPQPSDDIVIDGAAYSSADGMMPEVVDGYAGIEGKAVKTEDSGSISWRLEVAEEGLYRMMIRYYPLQGKGTDIERELLIDGQSPFFEARNLTFDRLWTDSGPIKRDFRGNDQYVTQIEQPAWQDVYLKSADGRYVQPYSFYFSKGKHIITLVSAKEPMMIRHITLSPVRELTSYASVAKGYRDSGYKAASNVFVKVQGENASLKSNQVLYPVMDRSSPKTEPSHVSKIRLNTIGGVNWSKAGQWIAWDIDVPEDGLYKLGIKYLQNFQRGVISYRTLYVDDRIPFAEAESISFAFSTNWQFKELGIEGEPFLFYLSKGKHRIKLEATLGDMAVNLRSVESAVLDLNRLFRSFVMITGSVPDEYRDYQLDQKIPGLIDDLKAQSRSLTRIRDSIKRVSQGSGDRTATLNRLIYQLQDMAARPETIPRQQSTFKSNISSLGDWMFTVNNVPLTIDYLAAASPEQDWPSASAGWLQGLSYDIGSFGASFFNDYQVLRTGENSGKKIEVWMTVGLDQAKVLRRMIDAYFTPETGISVDMKLVGEGVLMQAMLAGTGPDVALTVPQDRPINYAMRSGVESLSNFPDFEDVMKRFHPSARVPFEFEGDTYALPNDQAFPVMFYRKDILDELGLKVPETWDDVYALIPELQKNNLLFGFPIVQSGAEAAAVVGNLTVNSNFATMLFQRGEQLYKDGGKMTNLDSKIAIQAFQDWTELYTIYKLPLTINFVNRFRSGEMPIGIADYTQFNWISVAAPELKGLWEFTLVPGTKQPDGSVRHDVPSITNGIVMLKASKHKDEAWSFMKWMTSAEIQAKYGLENEAIFGLAGRYATANLEAASMLPWRVGEYRSLTEQWKSVQGIPEVPGGYFTGRHLDNAFRRVTVSNEDPRESLDMYNRFINEEIKKKRAEFGLPN